MCKKTSRNFSFNIRLLFCDTIALSKQKEAQMRNPIQVKLGSSTFKGFYSMDVEKVYTEIQKDRMPYNVLSILSESTLRVELGMSELSISDNLLSIQPELAVDQYGYSSTLPILLKDFIKGKLVQKSGSKFKITPLGIDFLKNNTRD